MNEFHITDEVKGGNTIHIRQYDDETSWVIEAANQPPRITRRLLATGARVQENKYAVRFCALP